MSWTTTDKTKAVTTNESAKGQYALRKEAMLQQIKESQENDKSFLCLGIWGEPKTVKSGIALDSPDKQIYVLDWDDGCEPTWRQNHQMTERITLWNPEVRNQNGELDIQKSEANSEDFVLFVLLGFFY